LSDGAPDARKGLAWALIQQERCPEGIRILNEILKEEPDDVSLEAALEACRQRAHLNGDIWAALSGSLYQDHPWMQLAESASGGLRLQPWRHYQIGAAYRFIRLEPSDARVASLVQHEVYAQGGYTSPRLDLQATAAWIWGGDILVGSSRHAGAALRSRYLGRYPGNFLLETSASYYRDLWVVAFSPSWTQTLGPLSVTAGVSTQQFAHDTLLSASLWLGFGSGSASFSLGGRYGSEYRAAYLSQLSVFNAEERSIWAILANAGMRLSQHWTLFAGYGAIRLRSRDGLLSTLHSISTGTVFTL
jgi:hypothetical protein